MQIRTGTGNDAGTKNSILLGLIGEHKYKKRMRLKDIADKAG